MNTGNTGNTGTTITFPDNREAYFMRITIVGRGPEVSADTRFRGKCVAPNVRGFARQRNYTLVEDDGLKKVTIIRRPAVRPWAESPQGE